MPFKTVMLYYVHTIRNMYIARNIISHPEVRLLFHNIQIEGKLWDCAMNLILYLTGQNPPELEVLDLPHTLVLGANR